MNSLFSNARRILSNSTPSSLDLLYVKEFKHKNRVSGSIKTETIGQRNDFLAFLPHDIIFSICVNYLDIKTIINLQQVSKSCHDGKLIANNSNFIILQFFKVSCYGNNSFQSTVIQCKLSMSVVPGINGSNSITFIFHQQKKIT